MPLIPALRGRGRQISEFQNLKKKKLGLGMRPTFLHFHHSYHHSLKVTVPTFKTKQSLLKRGKENRVHILCGQVAVERV